MAVAGGTQLSLTLAIPSVPADHWKAEYFGNAMLGGAPVAVVDEGTGFVDHSWGDGPAGGADGSLLGAVHADCDARGRAVSLHGDDG